MSGLVGEVSDERTEFESDATTGGPTTEAEQRAQPASLAAVNHGGELLSGTRQKRVAASFQLNVDDVARSACPQCGHQTEGQGLALNLTLGPIAEGLQVLLITPGSDMRSVVDDVKRTLVYGALRQTGGNQARAAKLLGMKYTTFHALVRRLGIKGREAARGLRRAGLVVHRSSVATSGSPPSSEIPPNTENSTHTVPPSSSTSIAQRASAATSSMSRAGAWNEYSRS